MDIQTVSVSSLAIVILARTVWELAKDRRANGRNGRNGGDKGKMPQRIKELYVMHSKTNADGAPIWYFPQSVEQNIEKMANHLENIEKGMNGK